MNIFGYYKCICGQEYVSDFAFKKTRCLECGAELDVIEIPEAIAVELKQKWAESKTVETSEGKCLVKKISFSEIWEDLIPSEEKEAAKIQLELLVNEADAQEAMQQLRKSYENWMYNECENSLLLNKYSKDELLQIPICDYMLLWLDVCNIKFVLLGSE